MAIFITPTFLEKIATDGRLLDGLRLLESKSPKEREAVPVLPRLKSWDCILEEVLDTDHEAEYYVRFAKELRARGYSRADIKEMRLVAWETAGWYNFEMMAWDWCELNESDMMAGLKNRLEIGDIDERRFGELKSKIDRYRNAPKKSE